jgi:hypothetical protein
MSLHIPNAIETEDLIYTSPLKIKGEESLIQLTEAGNDLVIPLSIAQLFAAMIFLFQSKHMKLKKQLKDDGGKYFGFVFNKTIINPEKPFERLGINEIIIKIKDREINIRQVYKPYPYAPLAIVKRERVISVKNVFDADEDVFYFLKSLI